MDHTNKFIIEAFKHHGDEEFIGEGSFGNVYKFSKKGKVFAVKKILQRRLQDNITHEKDLLELVYHKHIIQYFYSRKSLDSSEGKLTNVNHLLKASLNESQLQLEAGRLCCWLHAS